MSKFAQTPAAPYYAVIFTSVRRASPADADDGYAAMADAMMALAARQPGRDHRGPVLPCAGQGLLRGHTPALQVELHRREAELCAHGGRSLREMIEETKEAVMRFAASGFRDFTRIAASDPSVWRDILLTNREEVLAHFTGKGEPVRTDSFDPAPLHAARVPDPDLANAARAVARWCELHDIPVTRLTGAQLAAGALDRRFGCALRLDSLQGIVEAIQHHGLFVAREDFPQQTARRA